MMTSFMLRATDVQKEGEEASGSRGAAPHRLAVIIILILIMHYENSLVDMTDLFPYNRLLHWKRSHLKCKV